MTKLTAVPGQARQLTLEGAMLRISPVRRGLLWRDQPGTRRREGLLLTTDVCANPACSERHIGVQALRVEGDLVHVETNRDEIATAYPPGSTATTRRAFFVNIDPDDGRVAPQGDRPDADALAWFRSELDAELLAIRLARFEGARRRLIEEAARRSPVRRVAAASRNEPCPCGSGRTYKRCCGAA